PWVLKQGDEFELLTGPDDNNDARPDRLEASRTFRLENSGQGVPFRMGGRSQVVLEIRRISSGSGKPLFADLALTSQDVQFRPEFGKIDVAVHNIGAAAAQQVTVVLLDEHQKEIGRQTIPHLAAPLDLDPQVVRVGFPFDLAGAAGRKFTAILDPENRLREITKTNNRATAVCPAMLARRKAHSHP
ncbi:MAG: hypothetical protein L0Z62_26160, partial [Gemmataceae bacterium]|nr:hypothetical protein [Gemmataceae bacterium]